MIREFRTWFCARILFVFFVASVGHAQQPLLQMMFPHNGSPLQEGQTYTIVLSVDPSVQSVSVVAQYPLPQAQPTSDPTQFTLTLPTNIAPGTYSIGAVGMTSSGDVESAPVMVDVERQDTPVSLTAQPLLISFKSTGEKQPILAWGTYADGAKLMVSNSTKTTYLSNNTQVATVIANGTGYGIVTATGPGQTSIVVQSGSASFPVSVQVAQAPYAGAAPTISGVTPASGTPGATRSRSRVQALALHKEMASCSWEH